MSHQPKDNQANGNGRLFAILAYILPVIGGIFGLAVNRDNALTRTHAQQSIGAVLTLIFGFITWAVFAYVIALIPAIRPIVIALTYILIGLSVLAFLYFLSRLDADDKFRAVGIRKLIWVAVIYGIGGVLVWLSQTNPDAVAFAVPVIELLLPVSELFMPVLLLVTVILMGGGVLPSRVSFVLSIMIAVNLLTWMPLAGPVISVALYGLFIALVIFLIFNWVFNLISAVQGNERKIPIANQLVGRLFGDERKSKDMETAPATA